MACTENSQISQILKNTDLLVKTKGTKKLPPQERVQNAIRHMMACCIREESPVDTFYLRDPSTDSADANLAYYFKMYDIAAIQEARGLTEQNSIIETAHLHDQSQTYSQSIIRSLRKDFKDLDCKVVQNALPRGFTLKKIPVVVGGQQEQHLKVARSSNDAEPSAVEEESGEMEALRAEIVELQEQVKKRQDSALQNDLNDALGDLEEKQLEVDMKVKEVEELKEEVAKYEAGGKEAKKEEAEDEEQATKIEALQERVNFFERMNQVKDQELAKKDDDLVKKDKELLALRVEVTEVEDRQKKELKTQKKKHKKEVESNIATCHIWMEQHSEKCRAATQAAAQAVRAAQAVEQAMTNVNEIPELAGIKRKRDDDDFSHDGDSAADDDSVDDDDSSDDGESDSDSNSAGPSTFGGTF